MKADLKQVVALAALAVVARSATHESIRGFDRPSQAMEVKWEQQARAIPDPTRIRTTMQKLSRQAHLAGTPQSKETAEYILAQLREYGLEAHIEQYEAMLPQPKLRSLEMTEPVAFRAKLEEPEVAGDQYSADAGMIPSF